MIIMLLEIFANIMTGIFLFFLLLFLIAVICDKLETKMENKITRADIDKAVAVEVVERNGKSDLIIPSANYYTCYEESIKSRESDGNLDFVDKDNEFLRMLQNKNRS